MNHQMYDLLANDGNLDLQNIKMFQHIFKSDWPMPYMQLDTTLKSHHNLTVLPLIRILLRIPSSWTFEIQSACSWQSYLQLIPASLFSSCIQFNCALLSIGNLPIPWMQWKHASSLLPTLQSSSILSEFRLGSLLCYQELHLVVHTVVLPLYTLTQLLLYRLHLQWRSVPMLSILIPYQRFRLL